MHAERRRRPPLLLLQLVLGVLEPKARGHLGDEVLADLVDHLLAAEAAAGPAHLGHGLDLRVDAVLHLQRPEGEVGVGVEPEDLGALLPGHLLDLLPEHRYLRVVRHHPAREELVARLQHPRVEVLLRVGVHQDGVEVVRDAPAVLDLRDHVAHRGPRGLVLLLGVHLHEVVAEELRARREVRLVELVRHVPADGPKLAPLLHHRVHEAHDEEQLPPLLALHRVEEVLAGPRVRGAEAGAHAHGGLVGDLDAHLQQADGELRVRLGGDPEAEVLVDLLRLDQEGLHLAQVPQAQVGVLEEHPLPLRGGHRHVLARDDLLPLAHGHRHDLYLLALGEVVN
mmetsp:Transcript_29465/g.94343  ORF Transcript_29465/g.94343 Transcript_29465/m.94343 type:complete len:339 (+) Transcript_29465:1535-2551(+)